jgi:hypothetical protein
MSFAEPPADAPEVRPDSGGRMHVEGEHLSDLPQVLEQARGLEGLVVTGTAQGSGHWTLECTFRGHRFDIHTNYHAGLTVYSACDPDCPELLLREIVDYFECSRPPLPPWQPPPPLDGRRLLLLFLVALAVAVPLVVFLVLLRKR